MTKESKELKVENIRPTLMVGIEKFAESIGTEKDSLATQIIEYANKYGTTIMQAKKQVCDELSSSVLAENLEIRGVFLKHREIDDSIIELTIVNSDECINLRGLSSQLPKIDAEPLIGMTAKPVRKIRRKMRGNKTEVFYEFNEKTVVKTFVVTDYTEFTIDPSAITQEDVDSWRMLIFTGVIKNVWATSDYDKKTNTFGDKKPVVIDDGGEPLPLFQLVMQPDKGDWEVSSNVKKFVWNEDAFLGRDELLEIAETYGTANEQANELLSMIEGEQIMMGGRVAAIKDKTSAITVVPTVLVFTEREELQTVVEIESTESEEEEVPSKEEPIQKEPTAATETPAVDEDTNEDNVEVLKHMTEAKEGESNMTQVIKAFPKLAADIPNILESLQKKGNIIFLPEGNVYKVVPE